MPRLLRDILCVIETFHSYAQEDSNEATLTFRELKQLIQGEFGDILQPSVIHAVERNLDLLELNSNSTICFEEFLLAIFNLLNFCYLDIQSILTSEPRPGENPEEKPVDGDVQAISTTSHSTEGALPTQEKGVSPSGVPPPAQFNLEVTGGNGINRESSQGDIETLRMSGHKDSQKEHLRRDEQSKEEAQDAPATGDRETDAAGSKQAIHATKQVGQDKEMPKEGAKPTREKSGTELREQMEGEEGNLGTQSFPPKGVTLTPSEEQEIATSVEVQEHSRTQEPERKDKLTSEQADLPEQTASQKMFQMQKTASSENVSSLAETQETVEDAARAPTKIKSSAELEDSEEKAKSQDLPTQEKDETKDLNFQGDSKNIPEISAVDVKNKEGREPEVHEEAGQKESVRPHQPSVLEDHTQDEKMHEGLQELSKHGDTDGPKTRESASEAGNQNNHETKKTTYAKEEGTAEALASSKNDPKEEGVPETIERIQESTPLGWESQNIGKIQNKLVKEKAGEPVQDPEATVSQKEKGLSGIPKSWAPDATSSSELNDPPVQRESQGQVGLLAESAQGSLDAAQKQASSDENNTSQEAMMLEVTEGHEQLSKDQEQPPQREQGSKVKGPAPAVEPQEHPEAHKSTGEAENNFQEIEAPGALDADFIDQLSVTQLPVKKEDSGKELKFQDPSSKEEGGAPEMQEALVKSLHEDSSVSKLFQETESATSKQEKEQPLELVDADNDPQISAKKDHNTSVSQSDLKEKIQKGGERDWRVERETVYSNPLYTYLQEKIGQQADKTQEELQQKDQRGKESFPESCNSPSGSSLTNDNQVSQQSTKELVPGGESADTEQTSDALQALAYEQSCPQKETPALQRKEHTTKQ
ncbi:trichohyalin-like protein 1 [Erinaceus europaeus]|uniref:Trichohyalin-like protein 1 n=1 Tax=Erinaceus europaeus TaxID=9365 RepID=A0A1S3A7X8_ERIEU|nr:trichohyalin-like protein 1 [Erinaceus europaeus]